MVYSISSDLRTLILMLKRSKAILHLAFPIIIGQLGSIVQGFADTIMVGQYGTPELSASGFVNNVFNLVLFFALGLSYSTTPVVGSLWGQGRTDEARQVLGESIMVSILGCIASMALLFAVFFNVDLLGQPHELLHLIRPYFLVLLLSVPFIGVFNSLKQYSDATGNTRTPMWAMLVSNLFNIIGNYVLIFVCDLGLLGAGIATMLSRMFMAGWLYVAICRPFSSNSFHFGKIRGYMVKRLGRLGLNISVQLCLEAGSFNVAALFMGWICAPALAAHQVMCIIGSMCFMIYYGIGAAAAVRMSHYYGQKNMEEVRSTSSTALAITLAFGAVAAACVCIFRKPIIALFTDSEEVAILTFSLLPAFVCYQVGDAAQTIYANSLRAIADVKPLMLYAFIAYVVVSLPLSYFFAFILDMGAAGVWWGFPFGLSTAAVLYYWRFSKFKC